MALKRCHSRFKLFGVNHPEKWYDLSFNQDKVSSSAPTITPLTSPGLTADTSPRVRCIIPAPFNSRTKPHGLKLVHLPVVTHISARGLSTSMKAFQYDLKPGGPRSEGGKLFFDTHAVVRLFEDNGFSTQQAEVLVKILVRMTNSNMEVIYSDMVTKVQQEIMLQRVMSQIASVKKDMIILEKSEFSTLLAENEKLKIQLLQLKVQLADIMNKVRSDNILDLNLEKSRVKELKAEHEKKLLETRNDIMEMGQCSPVSLWSWVSIVFGCKQGYDYDVHITPGNTW
ncbi:mitochondrial calcium uniporter regulator 1 isoform X2 [Dicentrarchus labrax]|uniref:mitochondrial calcium uniporter regulator 1 isoform X2 n=1 Tax=Dicentrarchus labrax TaxID=13489 RepID=UPI0021F57C3D|nr:mitochondrial calcium uniporter regulator 1 isoform X2 [Dicentrarchus labrax]